MAALTRTLSHHFWLAHLFHTCRCVVRDLVLECDDSTHTDTLSQLLTGASPPYLLVYGKGLEPEMRLVALTRKPSRHLWLARLYNTCQCVTRDLDLECDDCSHTHALPSALTGASTPYLSVYGKGLGPGMRWLQSHAHSLSTIDWRISPTLVSVW